MASVAASWTVVAVSIVDELSGGTRVTPTTEIGFETSPSNIYAQVRIPNVGKITIGPGGTVTGGNISVAQVTTLLDYLTPCIETEAQAPSTAGIVYIQDVNAAGQLLDLFEITVQVPGTDLTSRVTQLVTQICDPSTDAAIIAALDELRALSGG